MTAPNGEDVSRLARAALAQSSLRFRRPLQDGSS